MTSAAQRLFLSDGFGATTIAAVAAEARVSVETVYKAFGGKPGLVRAICDQALAGEGPVPAEKRSDDLQTSEPDPSKIIRGWGELSAEVAPRVSPILLLLRAAAVTDPQMAGLRAEIDASRLGPHDPQRAHPGRPRTPPRRHDRRARGRDNVGLHLARAL